MSAASNCRPEAPGSALPRLPDNLDAIRSSCEALNAMRSDIETDMDAASRERLLGLSAEIRKLAAMIRRP
ncbi:MAG TPA: hypothetical protein PK812_04595 [Beijerinckiaceae bacterium]|nr:hypothetical protein [Beijerinckiaceae bacterium]